MPTSKPDRLPARPDLEWLRKRAKGMLAELRRARSDARLAEAQRAVARRYGFASWRALKAHVDDVRARAAAPEPLPEDLVARFLRLVGNGDRDAVAAMLRDAPALVNAVGPHPFWGGRPQPLHVAIETKRFEMVQLLLRAGADVNGSNDQYSHWSPLHIATGDGHGKSRRALLRRGARIGLVEALAMGDDARALRMLRRGRAALPAAVPSEGSLLMFARTPAAIDRLLALGVSPDGKDRWGTRPIDAFSRLGRRGAQLVRHLASHSVEIEPEVLARLGDRAALARRCAEEPAVARRPGVIVAAAEFGHRALVSWLLDRGADPCARSIDRASHDTCLHAAAWKGDLAMVELLLARGADPLLRDDEHRETPAGWAEVAVRVTNNPLCAEVAARLRRAEADARG